MTEPESDTCRPVDLDGELIRVRGSSEMSDESRAALAEVIRAAKRRFAAEHPARLTVDTITSDQLDALQLVAGKAAQFIDRWSDADNVARLDLWRELGAALSELDALDTPAQRPEAATGSGAATPSHSGGDAPSRSTVGP